MMSEIKIGGQAVIEGVMMRGPAAYALALRNPLTGGIEVQRFPLKPRPKTGPVTWPVLRGVIELFSVLWVGMKTLILSANRAVELEEEKARRAKAAAGEAPGPEPKQKGFSTLEMTLTLGGALLFAIFLFVGLPLLFTEGVGRVVPIGTLAYNAIDGGFRVLVFLAYLALIGLVPDIRRVFSYHGAEHKVIHAYEHRQPLTVAAAAAHGTAHPRCGTNFLFIVIIISIVVFAVTAREGWLWKLGSRLVLLPLIVGVSYEILKWSDRSKRVGHFLARPGLWLQRLTTREPDPAQLEVALASLKAVLDGAAEPAGSQPDAG